MSASTRHDLTVKFLKVRSPRLKKHPKAPMATASNYQLATAKTTMDPEEDDLTKKSKKKTTMAPPPESLMAVTMKSLTTAKTRKRKRAGPKLRRTATPVSETDDDDEEPRAKQPHGKSPKTKGSPSLALPSLFLPTEPGKATDGPPINEPPGQYVELGKNAPDNEEGYQNWIPPTRGGADAAVGASMMGNTVKKSPTGRKKSERSKSVSSTAEVVRCPSLVITDEDRQKLTNSLRKKVTGGPTWVGSPKSVRAPGNETDNYEPVEVGRLSGRKLLFAKSVDQKSSKEKKTVKKERKVCWIVILAFVVLALIGVIVVVTIFLVGRSKEAVTTPNAISEDDSNMTMIADTNTVSL